MGVPWLIMMNHGGSSFKRESLEPESLKPDSLRLRNRRKSANRPAPMP